MNKNHNKYLHGDTGTYLHNLWMDIRRRCYNKSRKDYKYYGGRGIKMHKLWIENYKMFKIWIIENIGDRPSDGHSLDRIDNNSGYYPDNLRWADMSLQKSNSGLYSSNSSGFIGVQWNKTNKNWRAVVNYKKRAHEIGSFKTKGDAVIARNRYIIENNLPHKIQMI